MPALWTSLRISARFEEEMPRVYGFTGVSRQHRSHVSDGFSWKNLKMLTKAVIGMSVGRYYWPRHGGRLGLL